MYCLKCGRDTGSDQVFCGRCLEDMAKHPIKPGTVVTLPQQNDTPAPRPLRYRIPNPEEQVVRLGRQVRRMGILMAVLSLLLCLVSAMLIYTLQNQSQLMPSDMGRNYTAIPTGQED